MFTLHTYYSIARAIFTKSSPYYIQYYIIGKCNLKCRQCNIVETNSRMNEMSLEEVKATAKNLKKIGAGIVLLTGGEPFMHPQLPEIVEIFTREKLNVRLQTAGTKYATEDKLRACYEAGGRDINVSVDSLDFLTMDYINSVPGSGENAINTIELISKIFRNKSAILSFGTVLSRFNYREIPAIVEFARRIGWYVSLVPVHITSTDSPKGFRSYDKLFVFPKTEHDRLDKLEENLVQLKSKSDVLFDSERFIRSSISFLKGKGVTWRHEGVCDSPNLYFAIRPNGDFTTCCDYTLKEPPKTYAETFPNLYSSGNIKNRADVKAIVKNCSGCHYGSYPEVTLSVRDPRTFLERTILVLKSGPGKLKKAPLQSDFVKGLEDVKKSFPEIYPSHQWLDADIKEKLSDWHDPEKRRQLIIQDAQERKLTNRVRGEGAETIIDAEKAEQ